MGILDNLDNATQSLQTYNSRCVHYNLIAQGVYQARERIGNPLSPEFRPYIVAGLIGFDMRRTMGDGNPYSPDGFQGRLSKCLDTLQDSLVGLANTNLATANLGSIRSRVETAYYCIANHCGVTGKEFNVGATKVLHWLFPDLFIILDRNAAAAFRKHHGVGFSQTTQPGYTPDKYFQCLEEAREEINQFGLDRFRALEAGTPLARIFDKIAFVVGGGAPRRSIG